MTKFVIKAFISFFFALSLDAHGQPIYDSSIEAMINGRVWVPASIAVKGSPFFLQTRNLEGDLLFDGKWYKTQKYAYDNFKDEIIVSVQKKDNTKRNIVLNPSLLEGFRFNTSGKLYFFLRGDKINYTLDAISYYQVFNTNALTYVIKWGKEQRVSSSGEKEFECVKINKLIPKSNFCWL